MAAIEVIGGGAGPNELGILVHSIGPPINKSHWNRFSPSLYHLANTPGVLEELVYDTPGISGPRMTLIALESSAIGLSGSRPSMPEAILT